MTRKEAIGAAATIMLGQDWGHEDLAALESDLADLAADSWGALAQEVLDKTGRTDLADAIWEGR